MSHISLSLFVLAHIFTENTYYWVIYTTYKVSHRRLLHMKNYLISFLFWHKFLCIKTSMQLESNSNDFYIFELHPLAMNYSSNLLVPLPNILSSGRIIGIYRYHAATAMQALWVKGLWILEFTRVFTYSMNLQRFIVLNFHSAWFLVIHCLLIFCRWLTLFLLWRYQNFLTYRTLKGHYLSILLRVKFLMMLEF